MTAQELIEVFADNIKALPLETITISTPNGPREVEALLLGDWALNENSAGWAATHRKSGYAGKSFDTPIEALISLGICLGAGLRPPDVITPDTFASIPRASASLERESSQPSPRWKAGL